MKILVFGSEGMVGSSICRIFDQNSSYSKIIKSNRKDTNLFDLEQTKKIIDDTRPEIIINAAARVGGIIANDTYRTEFILDNLKINMNILESIIPYNNLKLINLGSSCIYPLNADNPIKEDYLMTGPLEPTNSPYAMAKLTAVEIGDSLNKQYGHQIVNLMPTNLYGINDNYDEENSHVIPGLISRMHNAKTGNFDIFKVWGTGKPYREFLNVDDLSSAIDFVIKNNISDSLLNVGSGYEISISELVKKIQKVIDFKGKIDFDSTKPDGNPRKLLDSSKLFNYGWKPKIELTQGIEQTYDWFVKNIN